MKITNKPGPLQIGGPIAVENRTHDVPHAPVIFFDAVPTSGNINGNIAITLAVGRQLSVEGHVQMDFVAAGYLRCSVQGAQQLRSAIDNALALAEGAKAEPSTLN